MRIHLNKFGRVLTSRPAGTEAFNAIRPQLDLLNRQIEIDFNDVLSLAPSWADEFFTRMEEWSGKKLTFLPSSNASVVATLRILDEMRQSGNSQ